MNRASTSFLVLAFATLLVSFQSFAQRPNRPHPQGQPSPYSQPSDGRAEVITEQVRQTLRPFEILRLTQVLRLQQERGTEILNLSVLAQTYRGRAELTAQSFGRPLSAPERVRPQLSQINLVFPQQTQLEGLELVSSDEIIIESITATIRRSHIPGPGFPQGGQVMPNQLITLQLNQQVRGMAEIPLKQLVKQQLGLSLEGAEIERIVVEGQPVGGRFATVQVEMNNRFVSQAEPLSFGQRRQPIKLMTNEEVRGNLRLHIRGDAFIQEILIRVGQVRGGGFPQPLPPQRILVRQEIGQGRALELARLLPQETRPVTALSVEASTRFNQTELSLLSFQGQILGSILVTQIPMRHSRIQLIRPASLHELRLSSWAPVMIESLELEFGSDQFSIGGF